MADGTISDACPDRRAFGLSHDPWGRLVLIDADGLRHVGVEPVRAFPLTDPDRWISLVNTSGREVACIESLDDLPADARRKVEEELAAREFMPVIRRILSVSGDSSPTEWRVETDRGTTRFTVDNEDNVRRIAPGRALIVDAQGLRYQVPDAAALDPASRRILERYL